MPTLRRVAREIARTPLRVLKSLVARHLPKGESKPPLFLFGFNDWKTFMVDWFPDREVIFVKPMKVTPIEFAIDWKWRLLADPRSEVIAWQYKGLPFLKDWCRRRNIPFRYCEDGFVRSLALGAQKTPPLSLAFDRQDMYFNAQQPSDLETMLGCSPLLHDPIIIGRAAEAMDALLASKLSKYNLGRQSKPTAIYGAKKRKRILVIGQVERDASIVYGCARREFRNNDLVWLARLENPDAQIIYKPHPEVMHKTAEAISDPQLVSGAADILTADISLSDAFETIDHVYTITSLAGFEALMRGIKVTCVGCPFYSGWGLTDDRQPNPRRTRRLTIEQVFAAAYLLYPKYLDPVLKEPIEFERAIEILATMQKHQPKAKA